MRRIMLPLIALAAMGTTAKADVTLSGVLFGGPTQNAATCYLFNASNSSITVRSGVIRAASGTPATLDFNTCNNPLGAGATCVIQAGNPPGSIRIANNDAYSCEFIVRGNPAVSGEFELRNIGNQTQINTFSVIGRVPLTVRTGGGS